MGEKLRRRADSFDVLQETFATAVRIFDRFEMRNEASMINWLSKLAERSITDMAEKESAQKRNSDREVPLNRRGSDSSTSALGFEIEADFAVPLDRLIRDEEKELLDDCIQELEEKYREIILLRNYLGMNFGEIAAECNRPSEGAARMMHAKAMRDLTRLVESKSATP